MNSSYARFLNPFSKSKKRYDCCESKQYCDPPPCDDCCLPPEPCIETCARPCAPPCGPPCAPPCADPCEPCDPCCPPPCDPCAMICAPTPPKPACETLPHPVTVKVLERVRNPYGGFGEGFEYPPCKNVYPDVFFKSSSGTRRRPCRPRNCSQIRIAPKCQVNQQMPTVNNCMFGQPQCAFPSYGMWNPAFQSMGSTPNMRWF